MTPKDTQRVQIPPENDSPLATGGDVRKLSIRLTIEQIVSLCVLVLSLGGFYFKLNSQMGDMIAAVSAATATVNQLQGRMAAYDERSIRQEERDRLRSVDRYTAQMSEAAWRQAHSALTSAGVKIPPSEWPDIRAIQARYPQQVP